MWTSWKVKRESPDRLQRVCRPSVWLLCRPHAPKRHGGTRWTYLGQIRSSRPNVKDLPFLGGSIVNLMSPPPISEAAIEGRLAQHSDGDRAEDEEDDEEERESDQADADTSTAVDANEGRSTDDDLMDADDEASTHLMLPRRTRK